MPRPRRPSEPFKDRAGRIRSMRARMREMIKEGKGVPEMAAEFNIVRAGIRYHLRKMGEKP